MHPGKFYNPTQLIFCNMAGKDVKRLYALGSAKWYDSFKRLWNMMFVSGAEKELGKFLKENLDKDTSILELGCGTALNLEKILTLNLKFKSYLGLDFSKDMLGIAEHKFKGISNVRFLEKDITELSGLKGKFDIILCTWVLSHLSQPSSVVNNTQRLLGKDGKMFLICFTRPKWYVNFWLSPLSWPLFRAKYVPEDEIRKFRNVKLMQRHNSGIATTIHIHR